MRIVSLELENTKSYAKGKIEFTDGVNAIVGHNGAGKSTVLEAIGFALFDCLAGYKQSDFIREGAKSAEIIVTIVSGLDERAYQIVRRCGSSNLHAVYDPELGSKVCEGKADVLHFLRQQMGVDPTADLTRLFSDAVGVPQGTFTAAFLQTPAQRKAIFDPLLQVEEYKAAFDKLLEPLRALQRQEQEIAIEISGYQGRLERLPTLEAMIAERAQTLARIEQEGTTAKAQLASVSEERSGLDAIQQQLSALRTEQQQAEQKLATIGAQLQNAEQAQREAKVATTIVEENQADHQRYLDAQQGQKELEGAVRARQQLERKQNALDKELSLSAAEVTRLAKELEAISAAEAQVAALAAPVAEQEAMETALQQAQQQSARLESAQTQLKKTEGDYQRLTARLATLETKLQQASTLDDERTSQEQQSDQVKQRLDEAKERLLHLKVEADALKEQSNALAEIATALCPLCEQPLTPEHRQELAERNEARLITLRDNYRAAQQQIKNDEVTFTTIQERLKSIQQSLRTMPREDERAALQQELAAAEATLTSYREQVAQFMETPTQVRELQQRLQALRDPRQQQAVARATAARRQAVENTHTTAVTNQNELQAQHKAVSEALKEHASLDDDLAVLAATLQQTLNAYQQVLRYQQVASTLEQRNAEIAHLQEQRKHAEESVTAAVSQLTTTEAQFDGSRYQQLLGEEQLLRDRQNTLQAELTLLQREQLRAQEELTELQTLQAELATRIQRQQTIREQTEVLEALRNLLRQAGPYITKALIKQISDGAMQVFSDIMQDYTRHLSWKEDYGITLEIDGRERQFAQLSGGEQMSAALAVRLALLREMSNIDVAFFDEPTTNLDETRRDALARQILEVKGFRQLFVISHDDTFEQATQNLIRIARINGVSTVQQS
ncbi:MAG TPA: SMC family ATPase [Caldilineaceae bacterium]|nr:SMC family ATPase [Caldilineaceae bacterium]